MSSLQDLSFDQLVDAITEATARQVPMTVTVRIYDNWITFRSRALARVDGKLLVELPLSEATSPPHEFVAAEKIGLSFKLKHHKHIATVTVAGTMSYGLDDGTSIQALAVCMPSKMQRLQRRAYFRADVPPNRVVRASFWLGGADAEPKGTDPDNPVWSGKVNNISAGGFQVTTTPEAANAVEEGETLGVRLAFGAGTETIYADAQFRHLEWDEGQAVMGFQFVGLGESAQGREALQVLSARVSEFQQAQQVSAGRQNAMAKGRPTAQ